MHELSVCLALIGQVERIASERRAAAVSRIVLEIGPLSGIEPDLLRNAWPLAAAGTVAVDAELDITASRIVVRCSQCDAESEAATNRLVCGHCGDWRTRVVSGDEMLLLRLELENAASPGETPGEPQQRKQTMQ